LFDLLNVKYVIGHRNTPLDKKFVPVFDGSGDIRVYENKNVLPRAMLVPSAELARNADEALALIRTPGFEPKKTVILEGATARGLAQSSAPDYTVSSTQYRLNEITLQVDGSGKGYLVLADVYYPGWRAFVDGKDTEILRANYLFRAVPIEAGKHEVRFVYQPQTLYVGAALGILTLAGLIGWSIWWRRKNNAVRR
jgi:hypothetical protein